MLILLTGIQAGKKRQEAEKEYLKKLRAEQQIAEKEKAEETSWKEQQEEKTQENPAAEQDFPEENGEKSSADQKNTTIRVLISVDGTENYIHSEVKIFCSKAYIVKGDMTVKQEADTELCLSELLQTGQTIYVEAAENSEPLILKSVSRAQGTPNYQGVLEITRQKDGFRIINQVDLESYLKGVVPSELPADAPAEALCAQAVCARTYAVRQIREKRMAAWDADVDDTVSCQVYNNLPRQDSSDRAVDDTCGMVMLYEGKPIEAYFFSTSWGYTDTDEVWDTKEAAAYLKSVSVSQKAVEAMADGLVRENQPIWEKMPEQYFREKIARVDEGDYEKEDPWYRWKVTIPWKELKKRSEIQWPQLGTCTGLAIQERSPGGGVRLLEIQGSEQNVILKNEYRIRKFLSVKGLSVVRNDGSTCDTMDLLPSACFTIDDAKGEDGEEDIVFIGGGYGHGVGMSQNGAKHLAESGMEWREILHLFYQNITIENLQES